MPNFEQLDRLALLVQTFNNNPLGTLALVSIGAIVVCFAALVTVVYVVHRSRKD